MERVKGEKGGAPLPYLQFGKGALTWAAEAGDVEEVERRLTSKDQRALIDAQVREGRPLDGKHRSLWMVGGGRGGGGRWREEMVCGCRQVG